MTDTATALDSASLELVRDRLRDHDWGKITTEELAQALGISRMTLHRRGLSKDALLAQLAARLEGEYRDAIFPALVSTAPSPERLRSALTALCEVNERYLGLLEALGRAREYVFHEEGEGPVLTKVSFTDALRRILEDGIADGTLRAENPPEMATLLFNATGWTYRHMRTGHRWEPDHVREQVVSLLLDGVAA